MAAEGGGGGSGEEVGAAGDRYQSALMHLAGLLCIDVHIQGQLQVSIEFNADR